MTRPPSFQEVTMRLERYWADYGCLIWQPYSEKLGAGTANPATTLRVLASLAAIAALTLWRANGGWMSQTAVLFIGTMWVTRGSRLANQLSTRTLSYFNRLDSWTLRTLDPG